MKYQERLMRDLWLALIRDLTNEPTHYAMSNYFSKNDIVTLIRSAEQVASVILFSDDEDRRNNQFYRLYDFFLGPTPRISLEFYWESNWNDLQDLLFLLRFPKRYVADEEVESSLPDFWRINQQMKEREFNPNNIVMRYMRYHCHNLLKNYRLVDDGVCLSTGADFEKNKTQYDKLAFLESINPSLLGISLGAPCSGDYARPMVPACNRITSVPKNWKKRRNIAIESQWTTYNATRVADAILRCLPSFVAGEDQDWNQALCLAGSIDNSLSTIDSSAASDSVSCNLCRVILPWSVYKDLLAVTSIAPRAACLSYDSTNEPVTRMFLKKHYVTDNSADRGYWMPDTRGYGMVSTMGNRVTFPLEELVFSCCVLTAYSLCGEEPDASEIGIVGDDIIVPTHLATTVMDVLAICGFTVNRDKSFADDSYYRESCGVEGFHGIDISTDYWPRKIVKEGDLPVLVGLQHKLFAYPTANSRLVKEIRRFAPRMTMSYPGSPFDDIWDDYPVITEAFGAYQRNSGGPNQAGELNPSCEIHSTFSIRPDGEVDDRCERWYYYQWLRNPDINRPEDPWLDNIGYRNSQNKKSLGSTSTDPKLVNRKYLM